MALLQFKGLSFAYPLAQERALDDINISIEKGQYTILCGPSGCGKTTLLRHAKRELTPKGPMEGQVLFEGVPVEELDPFDAATKIGFVHQNPENQIVTDFVWHELAFGLESMALPTPVIRRRVAEMASFFGMEQWFKKPVEQLSGGQKQMLNLASVMVMNPELLVLDEPTSMLDPLAARNLLETIERINKELGVAVLLTEHRLDEVFPVADKVAVMDSGRIVALDNPWSLAASLGKNPGKSQLFFGLPSAVRIFSELDQPTTPLNVRDGKMALDRLMSGLPAAPAFDFRDAPVPADEPVLTAREVWFRHEKNSPDVLTGAELTLYRGEIFCLLGGNGTGKTTLLNVLCGLSKLHRGKVKLQKGMKLALLPQNPQALFTRDSLREELMDCAPEAAAKYWSNRLELDSLLDRHPYDLSGGEMQRAALAMVLLRTGEGGEAENAHQNAILLLDEPTKGMDAYAKRRLARTLSLLAQEGASFLIVTHDVDFAASYSHRCALMFDGALVSEDRPRAFFSGNRFYTTDANRIARSYFPEAITCEEVVQACQSCLSQSEQKRRDG